MADKAKGLVSMTPVVTVAAADDSDTVDVIHHDIKKTLGGKLDYEKADADDKWFYSTSIDVTTNADLLSGDFTEGGTISSGDDKVRFIFVKNSGTTNGTTETSSILYLTTNGTNPAATGNALAMGPGESMVLKFRTGQDVSSLHAATSSGTIRVTVAAIIDDI
jgi:hypothetical protein|tara:strand:- start:2141 stop:2629 length:489 start_codon:yes stop_codon:yes gene_type:complete